MQLFNNNYTFFLAVLVSMEFKKEKKLYKVFHYLQETTLSRNCTLFLSYHNQLGQSEIKLALIASGIKSASECISKELCLSFSIYFLCVFKLDNGICVRFSNKSLSECVFLGPKK